MTSELRGYQPPPLDDEPAYGPNENFPPAESDGAGGETTLDDARRAYVKMHYERFAAVFARCDAVGGMRLSFGLAPFLFGELWFLYRKMYLEGFLLLAASLAISAYMNTIYLAGPDPFPHLDAFIQLAGAIILALLGKALYWKATDRQLEKAMRHFPGQPYKALAWLDSTGGVNVPIVVIMVILKLIFYGFYGVVMAIAASI
jgi:Protein of unknown function (DUF2628).